MGVNGDMENKITGASALPRLSVLMFT